MGYIRGKNHFSDKNSIARRHAYEKGADEFKFVTKSMLRDLLKEINADKSNRHRIRDWNAIFLGFHLALRVTECACLDRHAMRHLKQSVVIIPTLKQTRKIQLVCGQCKAKKKASKRRLGQKVFCGECGNPIVVELPADEEIEADDAPPEKSLNHLEPQVIDQIESYMQKHMRPDQQYLFEPSGRPGVHVSAWTLQTAFNTYADRLGWDYRYTWHALRHGRGVQVWQEFKDRKILQDMLRHTSIDTGEIYIHLDPAGRDERRKVLAKAFDKELSLED